MYKNKKMIEGDPNLGKMACEIFDTSVSSRPDDTPRVENILTKLDRLIDLGSVKNVCVLGCGPRPQIIKILTGKGFSVTGVEPYDPFVRKAAEYVGSSVPIVRGAIEEIPLESCSQQMIFLESVLEHVDSVKKGLDEIYRILAPGGILFLITSNKHKISLSGENGEYNIPFYNWFPKSVKESYVFKHLHYDASLANYTERPAVHWFTYSSLCELGRQSGFYSFYSTVDLMREKDREISRSFLRRLLFDQMNGLKLLQRSAWLRSLALTQMGHTIIMAKRSEHRAKLEA